MLNVWDSWLGGSKGLGGWYFCLVIRMCDLGDRFVVRLSIRGRL